MEVLNVGDINKPRRTLCIGDIHGGHLALLQVLERSSFDKNLDRLICLGDYVDGWEESSGVIDTLIEISNSAQDHIFIKGNHDQWFIECLIDTDFQIKYYHSAWLSQGGEATYNSYKNSGKFNDKAHINFFNNLQNYYIDDNNRLFVHGGFESPHGVADEYPDSNLYWDRSLWKESLHTWIIKNKIIKNKYDDLYKYPSRASLYSEIYIGHTTCERVDNMKPVTIGNVTNLDTGAGWSGKLTLMDIDSKEYWQSDIVKELYPNSKGR